MPPGAVTSWRMGCVVCDAASELGALCRDCAREVAPYAGLIPEHIRSTAAKAKADAWLVDGFGAMHPTSDRATVGRARACGVSVLAASVSREHAELARVGSGWQVRDLGSRNGTFVGGIRAPGRMALRPPVAIRFGEVAMWFITDVRAASSATPSVPTGSARRGAHRFSLRAGELELCVVGGGEPTIGGTLLSRAPGGEWRERSLAPLEYHLLRTLCARACNEADPAIAIRGCVSVKELARELPFRTDAPGERHVRQIVQRARAALVEVGAPGVLVSRPGHGYYLTSAVTLAPPDPR